MIRVANEPTPLVRAPNTPAESVVRARTQPSQRSRRPSGLGDTHLEAGWTGASHFGCSMTAQQNNTRTPTGGIRSVKN